MKTITEREIIETVAALVIAANTALPEEVASSLERAEETEQSPLAREVLRDLCENRVAAAESGLPLCQDTGFYTVFVECGADVKLALSRALPTVIADGVKEGVSRGYLRACTADPLSRENLGTGAPAVVYTDLVCGDKLKLTVAPKGFGSENMSATRLLLPKAGEAGIIDFVCEVVRSAGGKPCPPLVLGVGIGGTADYCAVLAKRALLRPIGVHNPDARLMALEQKILQAVNALGVGPQGFGGDTTALFAAVEAYPTHIAGLPVSVNPCCHVCRHQSAVL